VLALIEVERGAKGKKKISIGDKPDGATIHALPIQVATTKTN
jgi:hypothetical protein